MFLLGAVPPSFLVRLRKRTINSSHDAIGPLHGRSNQRLGPRTRPAVVQVFGILQMPRHKDSRDDGQHALSAFFHLTLFGRERITTTSGSSRYIRFLFAQKRTTASNRSAIRKEGEKRESRSLGFGRGRLARAHACGNGPHKRLPGKIVARPSAAHDARSKPVRPLGLRIARA